MDDVSRKLITDWMHEVEEVMREILFAVSQGKALPENAEAFGIVRHGLDNMKRLQRELS